ncbi:MAG: ATP synthase subunit I [bacterium]|nr:ATP synthase subunit I [bacterium]
MNPVLQSDGERRRLKRTNWGLFGLMILVVGGGALAFGLDFGKGALVGSIVVAINFYLSQILLARLFKPGQARFPVAVFYILKLGLSMGFLFIAMSQFNIDLWGVMAGLTTLPLISLLTSFFGTAQPAEDLAKDQPDL